MAKRYTLPKDQKPIPQCAGCTKAGTTICKVIEYPALWWQRGPCTARTEDPCWEMECNADVAWYRKIMLKPAVGEA